jgi:RIO-like serine/threonine protein kinase
VAVFFNEYIRDDPVTEDDAKEVKEAFFELLDKALERGICFSDIQPANIHFVHDGKWKALWIDWGNEQIKTRSPAQRQDCRKKFERYWKYWLFDPKRRVEET